MEDTHVRKLQIHCFHKKTRRVYSTKQDNKQKSNKACEFYTISYYHCIHLCLRTQRMAIYKRNQFAASYYVK